MVPPAVADLPSILYGTAWKEERTRELTSQALAAGYRGIDTANQRKHYVEAAVGEAIAASGVPRAALFVQTKFTYQRGQDHRLPYDPAAPLADQVAQSFASSCEHLGTDVIDSYVLHGPWSDRLDRRGSRGLDRDGGAGRRRPGPPPRRVEHRRGPARRAVRRGAGAADVRAEPLLRAHRLGRRRARRVRAPRRRVPGLLAAHRQPARADPPDAGAVGEATASSPRARSSRSRAPSACCRSPARARARTSTPTWPPSRSR
jgi:hypothetical protein